MIEPFRPVPCQILIYFIEQIMYVSNSHIGKISNGYQVSVFDGSLKSFKENGDRVLKSPMLWNMEDNKYQKFPYLQTNS